MTEHGTRCLRAASWIVRLAVGGDRRRLCACAGPARHTVDDYRARRGAATTRQLEPLRERSRHARATHPTASMRRQAAQIEERAPCATCRHGAAAAPKATRPRRTVDQPVDEADDGTADGRYRMGFFAEFDVWLNALLATYIGDNTARDRRRCSSRRSSRLASSTSMVWGYLQLTGQIEEPFVAGVKRIGHAGRHPRARRCSLWLYNSRHRRHLLRVRQALCRRRSSVRHDSVGDRR